MICNFKNDRVHLLDLVDIKFLQDFQDAFAKSMNVASLTVDNEGPITKPSNFTDFCIKYTRGSELGCQRCNECDVNWGKCAAKNGEPVIYTCHSGLTDFAVPIMLNGKHIGSILGGQVLTQEPDEKHFRKIAREFGINEDEYIEALRKIKIIPLEQVKAAAQLLYVVANSISDMAHNNFEMIKKAQKEKFLNRIIEIIRDTLDISEIMTFTCEEMAKLFNVQRVLIAEFSNPKTYADFKVKKEHKTRTALSGLDFEDTDKMAAQYWGENLFQNSDTLAYDNIEETDTPQYFKDSYKKIGVESMIGSVVRKGQIKWGMIILFDYDKQRHWTDDEINFIKVIADQIYISIQQAKLHLANKKQTEREILLRKIIEIIRSSLDMDKTLKFICEEVAKLLNVQRATIVQFPDSENYESYNVRTEYKTNLDIKGLTSSEYKTKAAGYWGRNLAMNQEILAFDNIQKSDTPDYFRQCYYDLGVKSMIGFSIKKGDDQWGSLVLSEYNEYRHWTEDEIDLLKMISNQVYIAIQQSELYESVKKTAQKETILRSITEKIRSSLDLDETFYFICEEIAKVSGANRVGISEMVEKYKRDEVRGEYKTSKSIKGVKDIDKTKRAKVFEYLTNYVFLKNKPLIINNIEKSDIPDHVKSFYIDLDVKAVAIFPIKKGKDEWGILIITYNNEYKSWSEDEIKFLETILDQNYIAIKQAEMYDRTLLIAKREALVRSITEKIRSSLNLDETAHFICEETAKLFNVQRVVIASFMDAENYELSNVKKEYKSSPEINGISSSVEFKEVAVFWTSSISKSQKVLAYDNIEDSNAPEFFKRNYKMLGVKSAIGVPIKKDKDAWGNLILFEYNKYRHWTEEETTLLETIATQVYIAIKQSELYNMVQKTAENEKALRKIMSSSVDNFDLKEVINSIITETCQLFGADRCLFVEYNPINDSDESLTNYSEYLSSSDIVPVSTNMSEKIVLDAIVNILKKREISISENVATDKFKKKSKYFLSDILSIKSFLVVPVYYGEIDYGVIVMHYVNDYKKFKNEEIDLIKAIANQSAAVIHHAKLYEQIKKNEKYTRTVLNSINDCIITIDTEFIIETCNPAVEKIWGYAPSECIGQPLNILLNYDCEKQKQCTCLIQKSIYGIKKNSEEFPVEINLSKVVTEDKNVILLVIRDITERKRMEQMKNEFVSTVSHELRTPLTSLRGSLGLIKSGKMGELSDKINGLLDIANNNCTRLINLINDILDIEKIEAGKMDFNISTFELIQLVSQAIQLNLQFAQKFNVKIAFEKYLDNVFVKVDSSRLIQVITNLLSNAIKFSEANSLVDVSVIRIDDKVRVSVTNYGAEISPSFKNRIFQKFAQADSSDTRQKGGTGLGLSISKAIIEKMNGHIGYTSQNQQTSFYFDLPEFFENNKGIINE